MRCIYLVIFMIIVGLGYQYDVRYAYARFDKVRHHANALSAQCDQLEQQINQQTKRAKEQKIMQKTFTTIARKLLPTSTHFHQYVWNFLALAKNNHCQFITISPQLAEMHGAYQILPVQMTFMGSYRQIVAFLKAAQTQFPAVQWDDWAMVRAQPNMAGKDILMVNGLAKFYYYP